MIKNTKKKKVLNIEAYIHTTNLRKKLLILKGKKINSKNIKFTLFSYKTKDYFLSKIKNCTSQALCDIKLSAKNIKIKRQVSSLSIQISKIKEASTITQKRKFLSCLRIFFYDKFFQKIKNIKSRILAITLFIGKRDKSSKTILNKFKALGISHLAVISGFHFYINYLIFIYLSKLLLTIMNIVFSYFPNEYIHRLFPLLCISFYFCILPSTLPLRRAYIMIVLSELNLLLPLHIKTWKKLFITASLIIFLEPTAIFEYSFYLSFGAVIALTIQQENKNKNKHKHKTKLKVKNSIYLFIKDLIYSILFVYFYTLPLNLIFFKTFVFNSLLYNFIFIPITSCLLIIGNLSIWSIGIIPASFLEKALDLYIICLDFFYYKNSLKLIICDKIIFPIACYFVILLSITVIVKKYFSFPSRTC